MPLNPLTPLAGQALNRLFDAKDQKAVEAELAKIVAPLLARIEHLERRMAMLEGSSDPGARPERAEDV